MIETTKIASETERTGRAILEHEKIKTITARSKPTAGALRAQPKEEVVAAYPTRLSKAHLMSEPKDVLITGILQARFGRRAVETWSNQQE